MTHGDPAGALRRIVLLLFFFAAAATVADLLLVEHYEDPWQLVPFALLALGIVSAGAVVGAPGRATIQLFRVTAILLVLGGAIGMWLHYLGNMEFEREVSPALAGMELFWKAVKGAAPPSVAPAALVHIGLLGLAATVRHPALSAGVDVRWDGSKEEK